jgi:uncharacterized protein (DUF2384 family)
MSISYAEPTYQGSISSTGSAAYGPTFLVPDEIEADRRRTHVVSNRVKDPVLRDVLATFHVTLVHRPSSVAARFYQTTEWIAASQPSVTEYTPVLQAAANVYWSTNYVFAANEAFTGVYSNFGSNVSLIANEVAGTVSLWVSADKLLSNANRAPITLTSTRVSTVSEPSTSTLTAEAQSKVSVAAATVDQIADWLDVPVFHVLKATGIKKRTYHEWKRNAIRRPRLTSQGRLWDLYELVTDLVETMGTTRLQSWLHQGERRLSLLRHGSLDELATDAYTTVARTAARPQWVNAGSITSSAIPRREVTVSPMDPGDVVES